MDKRRYTMTFDKGHGADFTVLTVWDLSDHDNPRIVGKLTDPRQPDAIDAARADIARLTTDRDEVRSECAGLLRLATELRAERDAADLSYNRAQRELDAARADIAEANAAMDEAGEPRDDGEDALSLASRIRNLAVDRDIAVQNDRTMAAEVDRLTASLTAAEVGRDEERADRIHVAGLLVAVEAERDILRDERDGFEEACKNLAAERDSLAARVKALRRSALEHASWLVCGMYEVQDTPQGMRLSGSARRWLANERIEVRERLNNAAIAIRRDVDADKIAAPESKPAKPATEPQSYKGPFCFQCAKDETCDLEGIATCGAFVAAKPATAPKAAKVCGVCNGSGFRVGMVGDDWSCPACGGSGVAK
jgi:hypothetical protein